MPRVERRLALVLALVPVAPTAAAEKAPVLSAVVTSESVYVWSLKDPAQEEGALTTHSLRARASSRFHFPPF